MQTAGSPCHYIIVRRYVSYPTKYPFAFNLPVRKHSIPRYPTIRCLPPVKNPVHLNCQLPGPHLKHHTRQVCSRQKMNNSSCYLSERTANALVSDLRPVKISDQALEYINLILDEILCSLIAKAESIDPRDLKLKGIPAVFSAESSSTPTPTKTHFRIPSHGHRRSTSGFGSNSNINPLSTAPSPHEAGSRTLGRDAVNEAELELTAWNAARDQAKREDAFLKNARGLVPSIGAEAPFPIREAVDLLRLKVSAYSVSTL
jgi:hypothetical protein